MNPAVRRLTRSLDAAGAAACAIIVAALIFGGLMPLLSHRGDADASRRELAHQRQRVAAGKAAVAQLQRQLAEARAELARYPVHLEDARRVNHRLARITSLATSRGLEVQGVEPGGIARGLRYQTIALKLTGNGGYRGCVRFLHDLHEQLPDTAVIAVRLAGNPQQENGAPPTFEFELRWYAAPALATAVAE
jgi:Tfp pilus assembly protein PilO